MTKMCELYKSADWKAEKHVPVIDCPDSVAKDQVFEVKVTLGKEIAHPNETKHHISWIKVYFMPQGGKFPFEIGAFTLSSHGASAEGPDTSTVYTHHDVTCSMKTSVPGTIIASAYCNIHGLWENTKELAVS